MEKEKKIPVHIRPAEGKDIPDLEKLLCQVGEVHHQIRPDIFRSGALKYTAQELAELLEDGNRPVFVAEENQRVVGYAFCIHRNYDGTGVSTCRKEIYVDDVCVEENCRGQGIATALVNRVYAYAREQGCDFVTLNVWQGNEKAQRFYEHMGMTPRNINMEIKVSC